MPVLAPEGTVVLISVAEITVKVPGVPLNVTLVVPVRLFPKITTDAPTLPEVGNVSTKGASPIDKLKTVPTSFEPPPTVVP